MVLDAASRTLPFCRNASAEDRRKLIRSQMKNKSFDDEAERTVTN
jgi:hypothetical protein